MAKNYFDSKDKKDQEFQRRDEQMRIAALKANDMEEYIRQAKKAKNGRIFELLSQTDQFLRQLGMKVKVQKMAFQRIKNKD